MTGNIPLLINYRIKEGIKTEKNSTYLVVENDSFYETISFKNNIADKMLFIKKTTGEKIEVYLDKRIKAGDSHYYSKIRFVSETSDMKISLEINRIRFNVPVKVKSVNSFKLPKNVKLIQMY